MANGPGEAVRWPQSGYNSHFRLVLGTYCGNHAVISGIFFVCLARFSLSDLWKQTSNQQASIVEARPLFAR